MTTTCHSDLSTVGQTAQQVVRNNATSNDGKSVWTRLCDKTEAKTDRSVFKELIDGLYGSLGFRPLDGRGMRLWYMALADLAENELVFAIGQYLTCGSDRRLSPQVLRELSGVQNTRESAAIEAFDAAKQAIHTVGSYASPEFADPLIPKVIRHFGGWVDWCATPPNEWKFRRPQFVKAYVALSTNPARSPCRLINLVDVENSRTGMANEASRRQQRIAERTRGRIGRSQNNLEYEGRTFTGPDRQDALCD